MEIKNASNWMIKKNNHKLLGENIPLKCLRIRKGKMSGKKKTVQKKKKKEAAAISKIRQHTIGKMNKPWSQFFDKISKYGKSLIKWIEGKERKQITKIRIKRRRYSLTTIVKVEYPKEWTESTEIIMRYCS